MVEDGIQEKKRKKQGGLRAIPFILANEVCDRFASTGFGANMITYLTQQLHLPLVEASNTLTNFGGTSSLTPIIGGLIADSFAGRFWTITVGSIIYLLGMVSLTLSAVLPSLRPPPCPAGTKACRNASTWQMLAFYGSLAFTSIGSGGIRPCVVAFGADQIGPKGSGLGNGRWSFFNLYFFCMGVAVMAALTIVVYVQENVGWGWGLGIPTVAMSASVVAFAAGYPLYVRMKPGGSPLTRLTQVVAAAVKKWGLVKPVDPSLLYDNKELDADIATTGRLLHTDQLTFLDRAAIVTDDDFLATGPPRLWRLSTVHRVEELKSVIRMIPIWAGSIILIAAGSHSHTFAIQQARAMDRHITPSFEIPPASMSLFTVIAMLLGLALYDRIVIPLARRFHREITYFQRMGAGLVVAIIATVSAALVEAHRRSALAPISVFWMVPQHAVFGLAESLMSVGHMEFLYDQAPESMRSTATALFWLSASAGSYMGTLFVSAVCEWTKGRGEWLQDNINEGKLHYYYWLVTGIQVANLGYYLICVRFYMLKPLEAASIEDSPKGSDEEEGGRRGGGKATTATIEGREKL